MSLVLAVGVYAATFLAVVLACVIRDRGVRGDVLGLGGALCGGLGLLLIRSGIDGTDTPWVVMAVAWINLSILLGTGLAPMRLIRKEKRANNADVKVAILAVPVVLAIIIMIA